MWILANDTFRRALALLRSPVLVFAASLLGGSRLLGEAVEPSAKLTFEPYEIAIGSAKRQTVLTGFLLGGAVADLAVVSRDRLRVYGFGDSTWAPLLDATLRPEVLFVDVAHIGGRDRLIAYEPGRLNWFDPETATERALVAVTAHFNPPRRGEIPHVDVTRDVNGDARDDLVVPGVDGFLVFVQMSDGAFAEPVAIGPPIDMSRIYGADGYRYDPWSQSRVHEIDYNRDGRRDLVFWNEDHFAVHRQNERGLFASVAETFATDVAFDSDHFSALATGAMTGKVLHSLSDLNGDGVADLVVFSLQGRRTSSKRSTYEVHLGAPTADSSIAFAPDVDMAFKSDGRIQLGMERRDLDRDGRADLMFTTIAVQYLESSLWKKFKGFMGDDIWLHLEFYRMEAGLYRDKPNAIGRIQLDGVPSYQEPGWVPLDVALRGATHVSRKSQKRYLRAFNRTLLIGDVTGDGRADLLVEGIHKELRVFVGVPGPDLFAQRPQKVAVALPHDAEYTSLADLNGDGKQDILMHDPFPLRDVHGGPKRPPGTEAQRVTILIAR